MTRSLSISSRVSTLALAVALIAGPSPAAAQSLQGTGTFTHGTGSISTPDSVTTSISITSPQAVIDWTPFADGGTSGQDIVFQAGSTTATFSSASDFAVLNRIDVDDMTRMIRMDGTINSLVNGSTGGSVYFYSPSGIVLGATSIINVGSLVLTSLPVTVDGNGNFINGGLVEFGAAPDPFGNAVNLAARIETHPLSSISALNGGSYVAMVAPRVQHHGTIEVNGAAALVGAEAATITFRPSGLFDIQIDVGTTDPNGVAVYGDITGPASSGPGDNHRIYLAAVPKNTALTMLISDGADLGFDVAQAADVDGNAVVLSAGHDIFFGSAEFDESAAAGAAANATLFNANFTSAFFGTASGNLDATAFAGVLQFASDASFRSSGGYVQVEALGLDGLVDVGGNLTVNTDRFGQSDGQSVTAGQAAIYAQSGGTLVVDGNVNVSANGYGGDSFSTGVNAGNGTGGQILIQAEAGSSLFIGGTIFATSDGYGGQPGTAGVNAGNGAGGSVFIGTIGNAASFGLIGTTFASANGFGGHGDGSGNECFSCNGLGGTGTGGTVSIGTNSGVDSTAFFGDLVALYADGLGGRSATAGSAAGTGFGGNVYVFAAGGSQIEGYGLTFASDVTASAIGMGGESLTPGITAGLGDGGLVHIYATADSTMGIFGDLDVDADGVGGFNDFAVDGGDGLGGQVYMSVDGGNSFINVAGTADLEADGEGSFANSDCIGCGGIGGDGFGGTVQVYGGSGANNAIAFGTSLALSAEGYGGIGATGIAGIGDGGVASVNATAGLSLSVGTTLTIEADGYGGYGYNGNGGGEGIGGTAAIYGSGGDLDVFGDTFIDAGGTGGNTGIVAGGIGGDGTGGTAQIYANAGTLDFIGSVFVEAVGEGGNSAGGTGGDGFGGAASVASDGAAIHILANLNMDSGAIGGDGDVGGDATAMVSPPEDEGAPIAAAIYTGDGGSITVDGNTLVAAQAEGGNGADGNGGIATAGEVDVVSFFGDITLSSLSIGVSAYGGNGGNGGSGGDAFAGNVDVAFGMGGAAVGGSITLSSAFILADGFGGAGGNGVDGTAGGSGGAGGDGTGGNVILVGSAAGGTLDSGAAIITARGEGGAGGAGGTGASGTGGDGGAGGVGQGGFIQTGTISADQAPGSGGGATYTTLSIDTSGFGGNGGNGGTGAGGDGAGGNGGDALGGISLFLARGVLVSADTVQLFASATGGNAGIGLIDGNGGDATTGLIGVESKDRFGHPDERGTLLVGSITGIATAVGGTGAVNGQSSALGGSYFRVLNGDATIGSFSFTITGDVHDPSRGPSAVSVRDGTATIDSFSFVTSGELVLDGSNGSMLSDTITLSAGTFVPDTFNPTPPTGPATYFADSFFDITTGGDFITNANLDSGSDLTISAPGRIETASIVAAEFVDLNAIGGSMDIGNIVAGGDVSLLADTFINGGNIETTGGISAATASGNLDLADLIAGTDVLLDSGASMSLGDVTAQTGSVQASAVDVLSFASIAAGTFVTIDPTAIVGGDITALAGDVTATGDSIDIGNVTASDNVFLTALAGDLSTLDINAGIDVILDATGTITTGNISTFGTVDASGGSLNLGDVNASVLTFLSSSGDIATGDLVAFSSLTVDSAADFLFGSITAPLVDLDAPGSIIGGFIDSDGDITAVAGADIDVGDLTAGGFDGEVFQLGDISLTAGGDILAGLVSAAGSVSATAGGGITTDAIDALDFVWLVSGADIVTGPILAGGYIEMDSGGGISTDELDSGEHIDLLAAGDIVITTASAAQYFDIESTGGGIVTGDVSAGDAVEIFASGGDIDVGNLSAGITNPFPNGEYHIAVVATNGSMTVDSATALGDVYLGASANLTAGDIETGGRLLGLAGGDMNFSAITTNAQGRVHLGDFSMIALGGDFGETYDVEAVFNADPIPTGGSITIGGPVSTGLFQAAAGTGLTTGAIDATTIEASAGGTATINGLWSAQDVTLASNDIDITANGGISGAASGLVTLISTNATQALIGDGLTGSGYALSNAEFGRIEGGSVYILARGDASAAQDMLIGDLTVTGPAAGSTIENSEGILVFATGDVETQTSGGVIRVVGDITATGFGPTNAMEFYADVFELDAATGSISITSSGATLAGELGLYADQIHVAEGSILDQLAIDPQYSGYQDDLNAPAAVQRPEGVLNAGVIWIESDNLQNVLIQNTGTEETPAGFRANQIFLNEDLDVAGPPGSIDVVVNGQLVTEAGTLTGVAVRDLLVAGADLSPFTANSTINNCLLTGACGPIEPPEPPIPPGFTPTPGIQQEIVLLNDNPLPPPEFDNESFIDDNDESTDDGETSPIEPPQPLFDTSGLSDKSDVDDPVSGSGNPALMETPPPTSNQEMQQ